MDHALSSSKYSVSDEGREICPNWVCCRSALAVCLIFHLCKHRSQGNRASWNDISRPQRLVSRGLAAHIFLHVIIYPYNNAANKSLLIISSV